MGALHEGHCDVEHENGVKGGGCCIGLSFDNEPETLAIQDAVKVLLQGLGEDIDREGIRKTPFRVAKALREGTRGYKQKVEDIVQSALFPEAGLDEAVGHAGGVGGLVIVRDLDLFSYCESCLLPFQVKCHIGYIPSDNRVLGLSKLSRVADIFAKRLQDPQCLANEVCSALHEGIKPAGVAVVLQCLHINFPNLETFRLDSNHRERAKALVCSGSGAFKNEDADVWSDFLSLLTFRGINVDEILIRDSSGQCWCPSQSVLCIEASSTIKPLDARLVTAVDTILSSLGEDPSRKGLVGTPGRFLNWLMNFHSSNLEMKLNGFVHEPNRDISYNKEQMQLELNLPFCSQCEHHLLPFYGVVHVGYFCAEGSNPISRSLLQSVVHFYGFKLQVQERVTRQIAETVSSISGGDVMVVVEAYHTCMISRGIEKFGSNTATIAVLGRFSTDPKLRAMFLQRIPSLTASEGS